MKICFIVGAYPKMKCGVGDYTEKLATELANVGHEVSVITYKEANAYKQDNYNVYNIVENWDFSDKDTILTKLKDINPEVVHIQYPSDKFGKSLFTTVLPKLIKNTIDTKIIETVHEYLYYTPKRKLRNLINFVAADSIVVVEEQYINLIKKFLPIVSKKLKIDYIPISSNIPKSNLDKLGLKNLRASLKITNEKLISYFGFINELKGIEDLLDAFNIILKEDNVKLMILSELSQDNHYHRQIIDKINEYGLNDDVIITGFIDSSEEVADYLRMSDLCILPFRDGLSERNGSFLAAYNQGLPIITTGINKFDKDGIYYAKPQDASSIVEKYRYIKNNLYKLDRNVLSWNEIANKHINIYSK